VNPPPETMLLEGAIDAVQALKLLRLGIRGNAPMGDALEMIEHTIDELEFAISAAVDMRKKAA
jgi:hypothetical protein